MLGERRKMAGPVEILIVVGVFGITGLYLYLVHRFLRGSERGMKEPAGQGKPSSDRPESSPASPAQPGSVAAEADR